MSSKKGKNERWVRESLDGKSASWSCSYESEKCKECPVKCKKITLNRKVKGRPVKMVIHERKIKPEKKKKHSSSKKSSNEKSSIKKKSPKYPWLEDGSTSSSSEKEKKEKKKSEKSVSKKEKKKSEKSVSKKEESDSSSDSSEHSEPDIKVIDLGK